MEDWRTWVLAFLGVGAGGFLTSRAWGALTGRVRMFSSSPAVGLAVWRESMMPADWGASLAAFDFVSIKLVGGHDPCDGPECQRMIEVVRSSGAVPHGWGYHYARSVDEATREGAAAATACLAYQARAYWVNVEKEWAGQWGEPATGDPVSALAAFVATFRGQAPGVPLIFNGLAGSNLPGSLQAREVEIARMFDGWGPMIYGTRRATIAGKYRHGAAVADAAGVKFCPMPATGREENGSFWGFANSSASDPGLYALAAESPPAWICFYVGSKGGAMIAQANQENPSLIAAADRLKEPGAIG
jgi:hypothetical protein